MEPSRADNTESRVQLLAVKSSHKSSEALARFHRTYKSIFDFFFFTVELSHAIDDMRDIATEALAKVGNRNDNNRSLIAPPAKRKPARERLAEFSSIQSRNITISLVDNFLCYLSEIIQNVMIKRPEILRSSESIRFDEVLQFSKFADLKQYIVDKKINELSYRGMGEFESYVQSRFGIDLFASDEERSLLTIFIESRNIITHNRGVPNDIFMKRIRNHSHEQFSFTSGKRVHYGFDHLTILSNNTTIIARRLDDTICKKYKLKRNPDSKWNSDGQKT